MQKGFTEIVKKRKYENLVFRNYPIFTKAKIELG